MEGEEVFSAEMCLRGKKNTLFYIAKEIENLQVSDVVGFVTPKRKQLRKPVMVYDTQGQSYESTEEVKITASDYKKLKALADARKAVEDEQDEEEEE